MESTVEQNLWYSYLNMPNNLMMTSNVGYCCGWCIFQLCGAKNFYPWSRSILKGRFVIAGILTELGSNVGLVERPLVALFPYDISILLENISIFTVG